MPNTKIVFSVNTASYGSSFFLTGAINQRGKPWSVTYKSTWSHISKGKNLVCDLLLYGPPVSSPEGALLLVKTKNHDLWEVPTSEVHNFQTSCLSIRFRVKSETNFLHMFGDENEWTLYSVSD